MAVAVQQAPALLLCQLRRQGRGLGHLALEDDEVLVVNRTRNRKRMGHSTRGRMRHRGSNGGNRNDHPRKYQGLAHLTYLQI